MMDLLGRDEADDGICCIQFHVVNRQSILYLRRPRRDWQLRQGARPEFAQVAA